ncbi:MFS transporter [Fictibacillus enclensis]|uniref:MFS transporter n=1 Tax=Fictibacillus enclensis TaxID=1017270 RepID=A0A0V8JB77_9BACL|nr:MFS transporter [Fictibacillus enclensis]RXZ00154.1 MFS transporter [Fictibacillus sp. S7]SCB75463.1 Major Facilitator Superfamily protein [Fictibacillus enclensis]
MISSGGILRLENKKALPILFLVMFLVMVGFGIIIPVLPFFAEKVGASPAQLGFLMAVYSLMQLLFAPVWGRISDRIGRKPVMLIGIAGLAVSFFLMAVSSQLWMLFAARIAGGLLSSANMPTTMAYVADITTPENRGKGMGIVGAAVGLGFIFGPAIGGIFSESSLNTPFYLAGASSLITFFLVLFVLKESLPKDMRTTGNVKGASRWEAFKGEVSILFVLQLFISLSLSGLEATFAYFAAKKAGLDTNHLGYIFMIMGFAGALVQGGLVGRLTKKYGEGKVIQGGIVLSAVGFGLILLVHSFTTAAIFLSIFGIGNGVIRPSVSALLTKTSTSGHGSVTGLLSSFDSLGRIIGPPLGGWLFAKAAGLPYISGIVLSIIALVLYQVYRARAERFSEAG